MTTTLIGPEPIPEGSWFGGLDGGIASIGSEYVLQNDTAFDRTEVVKVMTSFPEGVNGVFPSDLITNTTGYHFQIVKYRQFPRITINVSGETNLTYLFTVPPQYLPIIPGTVETGEWVGRASYLGNNPWFISDDHANLNKAVTSGASNRANISLQKINAPVGNFTRDIINIDYTTGVGSVTFKYPASYDLDSDLPFDGPWTFSVGHDSTSGLPINLPTSWKPLSTWSDNRTRFAAGYVNVTIPAYTKAYIRLIQNATLNASVPTYSQHPEVTSFLTNASSYLISDVRDVYGNVYRVNLLDSTAWDEDLTLEDTVSSKGWMKVYRRRSYHTLVGNQTKNSIDRDFMSLTWYLYVPHNSRFITMEVRMGNDYRGAEPTPLTVVATGNGATTTYGFTAGDGTYKEEYGVGAESASGLDRPGKYSFYVIADTTGGTVEGRDNGKGQIVPFRHSWSKDDPYGTGNGVTTVFSNSLHLNPVKGGIRIYSLTGNTFATDDGVGGLSGTNISSGTVDYVTGAISITCTTAPANGEQLYITNAWSDPLTSVISGTINYSTGAVSVTFPNPVANGATVRMNYIRNTKNNFPLGNMGFTSWEVKHNAAQGSIADAYSMNRVKRHRNFALGTEGGYAQNPAYYSYLYAGFGRVPITETVFNNPSAGIGPFSGRLTYGLDPLFPTTSGFWTGHEAVIKGSVSIKIGGVTATDNGSGQLTGAGVTSGTIDYTTGLFTITFTSTVSASTNFVATYLANLFIPAGDGVTRVGGNESNFQEHMSEGSSIPRRIFFGCVGNNSGSGSVTLAELTTWNAINVHPVYSFPRVDSDPNSDDLSTNTTAQTRAYGPFAGGYRLYSDGIIDKSTYIGALLPLDMLTFAQLMWNNQEVGQYVGADDPTYGNFYYQMYKGSRASTGWKEHAFDPEGTPGAQRNNHVACTLGYTAQTWQPFQYFYHAALATYYRYSFTFWNQSGAYPYVGDTTSTGAPLLGSDVFSGVDQQAKNGWIPEVPSSQRSRVGLGFVFRRGVGLMTLRFTNNSNVVTWDDPTGFTGDGHQGYRGVRNWFDSDAAYSRYQTWNGSIPSNGLQRVYVNGVQNPIEFTGGSYSAHEFYLASPWTGATGDYLYAMCNDPLPGEVDYPKNDVRSYGLWRVGCQQAARQHFWPPDSATHSGQGVHYEAWEMTGSWMVWDRVRATGELWLSLRKMRSRTAADFVGQTRGKAWQHKFLLAAWMVTKYLSTQAPFASSLTDTCKTMPRRIKEWLTYYTVSAIANTQPLGAFQLSGKKPFKGITNGDVETGEWANLIFAGPKASCYPALGAPFTAYPDKTEQQLKWSGPFASNDAGFGGVPFWQLSYWHPYLWAFSRELAGQSDIDSNYPLVSSIKGLAENFADALLDYGIYYSGLETDPDTQGIITFRNVKSGMFVNQVDVRMFAFTWNTSAAHRALPSNNNGPIYYDGTNGKPDYRLPASNAMPSVVYYKRVGFTENALPPGYENSPQYMIDNLVTRIPGTGQFQNPTSQDITSFEYGFLDAGTLTAPDPNVPCTSDGDHQQPYEWAKIRAPRQLAAFVGENGAGDGLNSATFPVLWFASRYHSDVSRRAAFANIISLWTREVVEASAIRQNVRTGLQRPEYDRSSSKSGVWSDSLMIDFNKSTGRFSYTTTGGLPTGWWKDPGSPYFRRYRIGCGTSHSQYDTSDTLRITIDSDIASHSRQNFNDVRIVYQDNANNFFEVGRELRVDPVSPAIYAYFKPYAAIPANEDIGTSTSYAYYVYYDSYDTAAAPTYVNTESLNGPFSTDSSTIFLLNMNGSVNHEATNTFNFQGIPPYLPLPSYTTLPGPFGGSATFLPASGVAANVMFAINAPALIPTGEFSYEFQLYVSSAYRAVAATPWTITSFYGSDANAWAMLIYLWPSSAGGRNQIHADFGFTGGPLLVDVEAASYPADQWFHMRYEFRGGDLNIYVNNTRVAGPFAATGTLRTPSAGAGFSLGAFVEVANTGTVYPLYGGLSEVRFSSTARNTNRKLATPTTTTLNTRQTRARVWSVNTPSTAWVAAVGTLAISAKTTISSLPSVSVPSKMAIYTNARSRTAPSTAYIAKADLTLKIDSMGSVATAAQRTSSGKGAIATITSRSASSAGYVQVLGNQRTLPSKGSVATPAALLASTAKGYIQSTGALASSTGKGSIATTPSPVSVNSKASINGASGQSISVTAKGSIGGFGQRSVSAGIYIQTNGNSLACSAKVTIFLLGTPSVTSKAAVASQKSSTVSSKAFVGEQLTKSSTVPSSIYILFARQISTPSKGSIASTQSQSVSSKMAVQGAAIQQSVVSAAYVFGVGTGVRTAPSKVYVASLKSLSLPSASYVTKIGTTSVTAKGLIVRIQSLGVDSKAEITMTGGLVQDIQSPTVITARGRRK